VTQLGHDLQDTDYPIEARSLGRTLLRWKHQIAAGTAPMSQTDPPRRSTTSSSGSSARVRVHVIPQLPDPLTALRRQAQLGLLATVTPAEIRRAIKGRLVRCPLILGNLSFMRLVARYWPTLTRSGRTEIASLGAATLVVVEVDVAVIPPELVDGGEGVR